jgi:Spy/CpxP family protein refolding chaperone
MRSFCFNFWPVMIVATMITVAPMARAQSDPQAVTTAQMPQVNNDESIGQRRPDPAKIAALKARIEKVKYEKIKTTLGLSDDQATKFFALYKPAEQDIEALVQKRNDAFLKVHEISNGTDQGANVEAELQNIKDLTQQIQARQQTLDQDLKPLLTPQQRAQLLVFEQAFNRRVSEAIVKHRIQRKLAQMRKRLQQLRKERQKPKN